MLSNFNGNLYRSDANGGTTAGPLKRGRRSYGYRKAKYLKVDDQPLSTVQKKQLKAMMTRKVNIARELKYFDVASLTNQTTQTWSVNNISGISLNVNDAARTGDEVEVRDIEVRWRAEAGTSAGVTNASFIVRCCIIQFFEDTTAITTTGGNFFQSTTGGGAYLSTYQHDLRRTYKVLYDESIKISLTGPTTDIRTVMVKPSRKKIRFVSSGTGAEGHIYFCYVSDQTAANYAPTIDWYSRVNFYDA